MFSSAKFIGVFKIQCVKNLRSIYSTRRLQLEPVSQKKADAGSAGLKHPLVACEKPWSCIVSPVPFKDDWPQPKIAVVGAGLAGLSAARRLVRSGLKDVVVVEALARPGGRVHTCHLGPSRVDLGGSEIYGASVANPAFNMAVMERLVEAEEPEKTFLEGPYYMPNGLIVYDVSKAYRVFTSAVIEAATLFAGSKKTENSVKVFIKQKLADAIDSNADENSREGMALIMSGMENEMRARWGDDLSNMSADYLGSYTDIPNRIIKLSKGASILLDPLLSDLTNKIRYNKPVQSIRWGSRFVAGSKRASVLCCDGEEIECDFVICTVSLGVLKAQAETLFSPPLPKPKLEAISNLSFGHVDKVFLQYDRPFWAPKEGIIKVGWNPHELDKRDDWIKGIGSIEEISDSVLSVTIAGREAIWAEGCSDVSVAEDLTKFLQKLTGDPSLPCPKNIVRSRWSSDIYFLGANSYMGLQSSVEDQCMLSYPLPDSPGKVEPVLFFAGEATATGHFSTLHGAMLSGVREADRILDICLKYKGPPLPIKQPEQKKEKK